MGPATASVFYGALHDPAPRGSRNITWWALVSVLGVPLRLHDAHALHPIRMSRHAWDEDDSRRQTSAATQNIGESHRQ